MGKTLEKVVVVSAQGAVATLLGVAGYMEDKTKNGL